MQPERLPLGKVFNVPFLSLDGTSVEMASLIFLFLVVIAISGVKRRRQLVRRFVQAGSFLVFYYVVYSCLGVFGMIRNGLYGMTLLGSAYSESFYWLALPVVVISVTLVMGPISMAFGAIAWAGALLAYAAAAAATAWGAAHGWDTRSFRVYYLAGGLLTAPLLGVGSLLRAGFRRAVPVGLVYSGIAVGVAVGGIATVVDEGPGK